VSSDSDGCHHLPQLDHASGSIAVETRATITVKGSLPGRPLLVISPLIPTVGAL